LTLAERPAPSTRMSLSKHDRERALTAAAYLCFCQLKEVEPDEEYVKKTGFGSVEAMRQQLRNWGTPDWVTQEAPNPKASNQAPHEPKARGSGPVTEMPPAANAISIFQGAIEKLSVFLERLPLRKEHRQGKRFVLTNSKPFMEAPEPGENVSHELEAPPDERPDDNGWVRFALDQGYRRVPGGAARYPDDELTAAIVAALLTGTSTDELLDALQWNPTQEAREQARVLFEGNTDNNTRRHSLKHKARQIAALMRGYPIGKGDRDNAVTKEHQAAALAAQRWRKYGCEDDEIARRLNEDDAYLPEFKKGRKVTVDDVGDLLSLEFKPY
jgi:hypothetical protein